MAPRGRDDAPPERRALDREGVLRAALALVDDADLNALSMRRLAARLGVTPMALYNHVSGRRDLLDGIADLVARDMAPRPAPADWHEQVRAWATAMRRAYLAHPHAVPAVQTTRATTPALMAPVEAVVAALEAAGFDRPTARAGWAAVVALVNGHVGYQLGGHMAGPGEAPLDFDAAFALALDALVTGLATAGLPR